eukprot:7288999-Pyramimonas_sp.AAC.1
MAEPAVAVAPVKEEKPEVTCDRCRQEFPEWKCMNVNRSLAASTGRTKIWRCKECNDTSNTLRTIKTKYPELHEGLQEMDSEGRAKFFDDCRGKLLPGIKKVLEESVSLKETAKRSEFQSVKPKAMAVSEARKLPMFIDNPAGLDNLLQVPGMSFQCPCTRIDMVYVPEYSKEATESVTRESVREQYVHGKASITDAQPKRKAREAKPETEEKVKPVKQLPKGLMAKAQQMLEDAEDSLAYSGRVINVARSPEGQRYVTQSFTEKCADNATACQSDKVKLRELVAANKLDDKNELQATMQRLGVLIDTMIIGITKVTGTSCKKKLEDERRGEGGTGRG